MNLVSAKYNFSESELNMISETIEVILPIKLAVEPLCWQGANLLKIDATLKFMINTLLNLKSSLSNEMVLEVNCSKGN